METNLLITYGSWADGTKGIAIHMAETLQQIPHIQPDIQPVKIVKDLKPYQAVIIGSPIRAGMLHPGVNKFIARHEAALAKIPSAFFISCLTMKDDTEANQEITRDYMKKILEKNPRFQPASLGLFGGVVNYQKLPYLFRMMFQKSKEMAEGDYRDWDKINQWTIETANRLLPN